MGRPVTNGIHQGMILGLALFNILVGDKNSGIEFTLRKPVDDTKLSCTVGSVERGDAIYRDLDRLEW